jgi:hypothetical protein
MTPSFQEVSLNLKIRRRTPTVALLLFGILWGSAIETKASLIINEVFNGNRSNREWIEFLVTTDITLGALDSIWFGDTNSATDSIDKSERFVSSEIISNVSYFTSTSDIVRAGTIIVVGGTSITSDFAYNPDSSDSGNHGIWNLTLSNGIGFTGNQPVNLGGSSDTVWISSSQPANNTDTSNFISAIAYLDSTSATGGGVIADYVTTQSATNTAFQTIHRGSGGGYDGSLANNRSLSNLGDSNIDFASSEGTGSLGIPNGGLNSSYISSLRAVPEPGAMIPLGLLVLGAACFQWRKRLKRSLAPENQSL